MRDAVECIEKIQELGLSVNLAPIYGEFAAFNFCLHNYHEVSICYLTVFIKDF